MDKIFQWQRIQVLRDEILQDIEVVESATYKGEVTAGAFEIDIKFTKNTAKLVKKSYFCI